MGSGLKPDFITPPKRHSKILSMGEEKVAVIENMYIKQDSTNHIMKVIQQQWGLLTDVSHTALKKQLQRYFADCVRPYIKDFANAKKREDEILAQAESGEIDQSSLPAPLVYLQKTVEKLDVLDEMEALILVQRDRTQKALTLESKLKEGVLLGDASQAITSLQKMYVTYAELQMDLGIRAKVPKHSMAEEPRELEKKAKQAHIESMASKDEALKAASAFVNIIESTAERIEND